jgi:hypothetical protein
VALGGNLFTPGPLFVTPYAGNLRGGDFNNDGKPDALSSADGNAKYFTVLINTTP